MSPDSLSTYGGKGGWLGLRLQVWRNMDYFASLVMTGSRTTDFVSLRESRRLSWQSKGFCFEGAGHDKR